MAEVFEQEIDHRDDLGRTVSARQVHHVDRDRFDVVDIRQQWDQLTASQRVSDQDVAEADQAEAEDRELHAGFRVVCDQVAVDLDRAHSLRSVERPVPELWLRREQQAVVLQQIVRRLRCPVRFEISRRSADHALHQADPACDQRLVLDLSAANREVDSFFRQVRQTVADGYIELTSGKRRMNSGTTGGN